MGGVGGQFFKNFGLTVVASVLMSLAVARLITPMVSAYFLKEHGAAEHAGGPLACVMVDEAQFLTDAQVWQLAAIADDMGIPVMCYGLRTDFQGNLFPGSARLLAIADVLREIRTICHCGKKATMVVRMDETGKALTDGDQVQIGGNETYVSLCRRHWREAVGDLAPQDD